MSEYQTIARPYAQAVFELAQASGDYQRWSEALAWTAAVAEDPQVQALAQDPRVDAASLVKLFEDVAGDKLFDEARNFLRLVIRNGRAFALSQVAERFEEMRAKAEGTIEAELITALEVNDEQRSALAQSRSRRLGREGTLRVEQDPQLIGYAVLRAGDLVIDASVRGRLRKLGATLAR